MYFAMFKEGFLKVSNIHDIYYATYGNKNGIPLIFVHGGPGGCSDPIKRVDGLDLDKFYCVFYDQRGCGKSTPNGELKENTTQYLIEDIKKLMDHLSVKKATFVGSSWGSCLILLFSISYPEMVEMMLLSSTFLARKSDSEWLYKGSRAIFPDLYEKFMEPIISKYKGDNIDGYLLETIEKSDFEEKKKIACLMANYEYSLMLMVFSNSTFRKPEDIEESDINSTRIFLHFESNNFFIENEYILKNADKIRNIPIKFYHGRFDMNCTIDGAYSLHKMLPNSKMIIVPYESHIGVLMKELQKSDINNLI